MRTAALMAALALVAALGFLVVDAEAETRRGSFRIAKLAAEVADRENENRALRNRVEARRLRLEHGPALKRAGLDVARAEVRRIPPPKAPPIARRPGP